MHLPKIFQPSDLVREHGNEVVIQLPYIVFTFQQGYSSGMFLNLLQVVSLALFEDVH